jgi:hypothetical protein
MAVVAAGEEAATAAEAVGVTKDILLMAVVVEGT